MIQSESEPEADAEAELEDVDVELAVRWAAAREAPEGTMTSTSAFSAVLSNSTSKSSRSGMKPSACCSSGVSVTGRGWCSTVGDHVFAFAFVLALGIERRASDGFFVGDDGPLPELE